MYYDKTVTRSMSAPEVFDYDGADTVEKQWTQRNKRS
jgi:hypothetical protein